MKWTCDIFPGEQETNKEYYTLHTQQPFTFFMWDTNKSSHHEHKNYYEIFVILKGEICHTINGQKKVMHVGDATIIPPNVAHELSPAGEGLKCRFVNITCHEDKISLLLANFLNIDASVIQPSDLRLSDKQFRTAKTYIDQIMTSRYKKNDHLILSSFFSYMLTIFAFELSNNPQTNTVKVLPAWLQNFLSRLDQMKLEEIEIHKLYTLSNYSQSAFSIQFKKYMNMTLVQYVNHLKLDYASNLLSKTSFSMQHIVQKIGFVNLGHFNRLFKKKYGITPSAYRKLHKAK